MVFGGLHPVLTQPLSFLPTTGMAVAFGVFVAGVLILALVVFIVAALLHFVIGRRQDAGRNPRGAV